MQIVLLPSFVSVAVMKAFPMFLATTLPSLTLTILESLLDHLTDDELLSDRTFN